jgi:hypothetical protein
MLAFKNTSPLLLVSPKGFLAIKYPSDLILGNTDQVAHRRILSENDSTTVSKCQDP